MMKFNFKLLLVAGLVSFSLANAPQAIAAKKPELKQVTYKYINKANELMAEDKLDEALKKLEELLQKGSVKNSKFDNAVTQQQLGAVWAQKQNYTKAAEYFAGAIEQGGLPVSSVQRLRINLAQIYASEEAFAKSARQIENWIEIRAADPELAKVAIPARTWLLLGNNYLQLQQYAKVEAPIRKAIAAAEKVNENWYMMIFRAHYERQLYQQASAVIDELIAINPARKAYWINQYSLQLQLKDEARALAVLRAAYRQGVFDSEQDYKRLADFLAYRGVPLKAAEVYNTGLESGIIESSAKNLKKLANYWELSRESDQAIARFEQVLQQEADPRLQIKVAGLFSRQDQHQKVLDILQELSPQATDRQRGQALFMQGLAFYNLKKPLRALEVMLEASRIETSGSSQRQASAWVNFLRQEI